MPFKGLFPHVNGLAFRIPAAQAQLASIKQKLGTLTDRKNSLMDKYLDGKIDRRTYDEQSERLSAEVADANAALREIEANEGQIDGLLDFAESVLRDPAALWAKASLDQRQR